MNMTQESQQQAQVTTETLVVGLGVTGLSVVRFLRARGESVAVTDSRSNPPGLLALQKELPDVPVTLGGFDAARFATAHRIIVSPGVALSDPLIVAARARGAEVIGDIELFAHHAHAPVAAITGSNGKTTVTTLLGEMAAASGRSVRVGGNIGRPALDLLTDSNPDFFILELSSFQLETTYSLYAAAAVVLNISPDHMDRYDDFSAYTASKQRIYRGRGVMVINRDDPSVLAMHSAGRKQVSFGLDRPQDGNFGVIEQDGERWLAKGNAALMPVNELCIAGAHNQANALAALALGEVMGLPMDAMLTTLRRFAGLWHRTQWVGEIGGVRWFNDSKGTNVGAALAAVEGLDGPLVLIAGGQAKGADFVPLREPMVRKGRAAVLIGEAAAAIETALDDAVPVQHAVDMADAVARASVLAQAGDAVLLSPACASFDMFDGYAARGDAFITAVRALRDAEVRV